jgi:hypothetical protein
MASLDTFEPCKLSQRLLQHRAIEKNEGIQCLRLGRFRNPTLDRQVIQKSLDFSPAHGVGMLLVVEVNVLPDPVTVAVLCAWAEMALAANDRDLIQ